VQVFVLYFSSRFEFDSDTLVEQALRTFGQQTGPGTSVALWDPTDPEFDRALALFGVLAPPALILARGLKGATARAADLSPQDLYTICFADPAVLGDRDQLASAVNTSHQILMRGDAREITRYLRARSAISLLDAIGRISNSVLNVVLKLKPKLGLPGGVSLQVG
jgi:hypothetical protein